jgi:hypothetical protein
MGTGVRRQRSREAPELSDITAIHRATDWKIAGHLIKIPSDATDANASDTSTYPHIVVICKFCAHSMSFGRTARSAT